MREHMSPYILNEKQGIPCYNEQEAAFSVLHEKNLIDITQYDLIKILEECEESYRIDYNPVFGDLTGETLIASHRGNDYHSKSGGARGHSFPTLGKDLTYKGGFQVDAKTKRLLYNPGAMIDGRDSYFLHKNSLQTQVDIDPILYHFLINGYKIFQTTYIKNQEMIRLHNDFMTSFHMMEAVKKAFFETTGFSPQETYVVEGEIGLGDIQQNNLLPRKGWPQYSTKKELIDILQKEHRTTSR